jgi:endoglucanase
MSSFAVEASHKDYGHRRYLQENCFDSMTWQSYGGAILLNGSPFRLKGANWFGFDTELNILHGLWGSTTMDNMLDFCVEYKFNALRIPLNLQLALDPTTEFDDGLCTECTTTFSFDAIDLLMDKAASKGILILFDMHNLGPGQSTELWYSDDYPEDKFIEGWVNILNEFGSKPNFMGIDLFNEPHGAATWGMGLDTDWDKGAERIVAGIVESIPTYDKLILVEGVAAGGAPSPYPTSDPAYTKFWGSNLDGLYTTEVDFGSQSLNDLLIYSSHIYGPDLYPQYYFFASDFPDNMYGIWDKQVGFIESYVNKAVIIGEWGGTMTGRDLTLQLEWVKYMAEKCLADSFYWALNPNSGDLGGLLKSDWVTPEAEKLVIVDSAQPDPSVFTQAITSTSVCLDYGSYTNGATCWASTTSTKPSDDITCSTGKLNAAATICCSSGCKQCGGLGCGTVANGGSTNCCASGIVPSQKYCESSLPPCIM